MTTEKRDPEQERREAAVARYNTNPCNCRGKADNARADREFEYLVNPCPRCGRLLLNAIAHTAQKISVTGSERSIREMSEDMMVKVMGMSGIGINPNTWRNWQPTKVVVGNIAGIDQTVRCFATDGNLAIFQSTDSNNKMGAWFVGHVRDFTYACGEDTKTGCPPSLFAKDPAGKKPATKKKKAPTRSEKLLALLGL